MINFIKFSHPFKLLICRKAKYKLKIIHHQIFNRSIIYKKSRTLNVIRSSLSSFMLIFKNISLYQPIADYLSLNIKSVTNLHISKLTSNIILKQVILVKCSK